MYKFSNKSLRELRTCVLPLQHIANKAISYIDFSVVEGLRTHNRQKSLFIAGKTKTMQSMHLSTKKVRLSRAFDLLPYPFKESDWSNREKLALFAGIILGIAKSEGIELIWGGDWGESRDPTKTSFYDAMHFQIKGNL